MFFSISSLVSVLFTSC